MAATAEHVEREMLAVHHRLRPRPVGKRKPPRAIPSREEQMGIASAVGRRMIRAREVAGYSQARAAEALGYSNGSKLAKVESGVDSTSVPLWLLRRAAQLYGVSIDYLLGVSECMDSDEPREQAARDLMSLVREQYERQRHVDVMVTVAMLERVAEIERAVVALTRHAGDVQAAVATVAERNPGWPDLVGGARLQHAATALETLTRGLAARLLVLHKDAARARQTPVSSPQAQLDLIRGG
jgi:transcriptional regulator with XRE-family HTH domain